MTHERGFDIADAHAGKHEVPRWRPAFFIGLSVKLHLACGVLIVIFPAWWPLATAALVANHVVIIVSVFCPRGQLLGPNLRRLPPACATRREIALTFDDGPDPHVTPHVLNVLDRYGMKASFFCIGAKAHAHPDLVREIVRRGHAVENHSDSHVHWFAALGPWRMAREIERAQARLAHIAGQSPAFFRAPNGFRNPWLDPLLARRGLRYVSWSRRGLDSVRRNARDVADVLTRNIQPGEILLLHDGSSARTPEGERTVLAALPVVLERLANLGFASVTLRQGFERR